MSHGREELESKSEAKSGLSHTIGVERRMNSAYNQIKEFLLFPFNNMKFI